MRVKALLVAGLLGVLGLAGTSAAEKVRTNASAKVYNRPGERGKVIVKVKEGQAMTVLAKEGRWLKVRVSGRTGYVPRTKVDMPEGDEEFARNTRRRPFVDGRSTKRTFGGGGEAPDDRIGADATGENELGGDDEGGEDEGGDEPAKPTKKPKKPEKPDKGDDEEDPVAESGGSDEGADEEEPVDAEEEEAPKDSRKRARVAAKTKTYMEANKGSEEQFTATPKDHLYIEQEDGKWTEVSTDDGDIGWVQTSKLEVEGGDDEDDGGGGGARGGRMIDVRARLGITLVGQTMTSAGGGTKWPDRYSVGSSAAAISLGGALLYPYKKNYLVGGEVVYDIAKAVPGIGFDPDGVAGPMMSATTGFTMHNLNVRGLFGYDFHKSNGMVAFGRLAYHYESLLFDDVTNLVKNTARLPSETIQGPMIGASFAIPALTPKFGARISVDAILIGGSVSQTKNLEDGQDPSVAKYIIGVGGIYRYKPTFDISFGYDLNYASLSFGAPIATSMRGHMGTAVKRTDVNHTISVGLAKAF